MATTPREYRTDDSDFNFGFRFQLEGPPKRGTVVNLRQTISGPDTTKQTYRPTRLAGTNYIGWTNLAFEARYLDILNSRPVTGHSLHLDRLQLLDRWDRRREVGTGRKLEENGIRPRLPTVEKDLPGGARRLVQKAEGIKATVVNGAVALEDFEATGASAGEVLKGRIAS